MEADLQVCSSEFGPIDLSASPQFLILPHLSEQVFGRTLNINLLDRLDVRGRVNYENADFRGRET